MTVIDGGKKGFGKTVISAALFLTGLDIILDTVDSIKTSTETQQMIEKMEDYAVEIEEGKSLSSYGAYSFYYGSKYGDGSMDYYFGYPGNEPNINLQLDYVFTSNPEAMGVIKHVAHYSGVTDFVIEYTGRWWRSGGNASRSTQNKTVRLLSLSKLTALGIAVADYNKAMWLPNPSNIPSVPSVPWVNPWKSDPDTNKPVLPEEIPIEVPLTNPDTYSPGEPWNEPLPTYEPIPGSDPDKDKEYIPGSFPGSVPGVGEGFTGLPGIYCLSSSGS